MYLSQNKKKNGVIYVLGDLFQQKNCFNTIEPGPKVLFCVYFMCVNFFLFSLRAIDENFNMVQVCKLLFILNSKGWSHKTKWYPFLNSCISYNVIPSTTITTTNRIKHMINNHHFKILCRISDTLWTWTSSSKCVITRKHY